MANPPRLQVSGLSNITADEQAATSSPARGAEMRDFLQSRLQKKNRAPPLVCTWDFWHDRQDRAPQPQQPQPTADNFLGVPPPPPTDLDPATYETRLVHLAQVSDVKAFWNVFNNFDVLQLPLRDSIHLFHRGVKPIWEDPRNSRGGCWTFRVPKAVASEFWKEVCMMAIGEQLQSAVESDRTTFRDDICGISLAVRFNSLLVQIWNRDAAHEEGIERIKETVLNGVSDGLRPRDGSYYYKKHAEHSAFAGKAKEGVRPGTAQTASTNGSRPGTAN